MLVQEMYELVGALPDLRDSDRPLVEIAAYALADLRQLRDYIDAQGGLVTPQGGLYKVAEMYRNREKDAVKHLTDLGMGPRARALFMSRTVAGNPNSFAAQLAQARAQRAIPVAANG